MKTPIVRTKSFLMILFVFVFCALTAQSHRFIYEYKFVPDSTKIDSTITEYTRLEIFKHHSEFISELSAKRDSALLQSASKNSGEVGSDLPDGEFKNKVWKSKNKMYSTEFIGIQPFKVLNKGNFNWKLTDEKKMIQNYTCQKATLNYGNRIWEAWFTNDITVQDGPYIFRGLPGLIVQLADRKNHHSFLLVGNTKSPNAKSNSFELKLFKAFEITREKFQSKWKEFKTNPIGGTEQFLLMNPQIYNFKMFDENGNERNMNDVRKEDREKAIKKIKRENNYIDLELYE